MDEIDTKEPKEISLKKLKVKSTYFIKEWAVMSFYDGPTILTDGRIIYDITDYPKVKDIFEMFCGLCILTNNGFTAYVIKLDTMDVLFEDDRPDLVHIHDENDKRMLEVHFKHCKKLYDLKNRRYLPTPDNYSIENSYDSLFYVFVEENSDKKFYDLDRMITDAEGKILVEGIKGWIYFKDGVFFIYDKRTMTIIKPDDDLQIKTLSKGKGILVTPVYYDGHLVIVKENTVFLVTPDLKPVKTFADLDIKDITDIQVFGDILKLCLPYENDLGTQIYRHLFINFKTGKAISHVRIEHYPYWNPEVFLGYDNFGETDKQYVFYDENFDFITSVHASMVEDVSSDSDLIFELTYENGKTANLNIRTLKRKDSKYDFIKFSSHRTYGYGCDLKNKTIDFLDSNFDVVFKGLSYEELGLDPRSFGFFLINGYACITEHIAEGPRSLFRTIIVKEGCKPLLDSREHKAYLIGDVIEIIGRGCTEYLDTRTGRIKTLELKVPIDREGNIVLSRIDEKSELQENKIMRMFPINPKEDFN